MSLEHRLGAQLQIETFSWTGLNSHDARFEAARDLQTQLERQVRQYPDAEHFVIAHSHGGNIARYTLADAGLASAIKGLVCLATPYFRCERRNVDSTLGSLFWLLLPFGFFCVALAVVVVTMTIAGLTGAEDSPSTSRTTVDILAWPVLFVVVPAMLGAAWMATSWVTTRIKNLIGLRILDRQSSIHQRYQMPYAGHDGPHILSVQPVWDEATLYLTWVRRLSMIPFYVWVPELWLLFFAGLAGLMFIGMLVASPSLVDQLSNTYRTGIGLGDAVGFIIGIAGTLLLPFVAFALVFVLMQTLMFVIPRIVRAHPLGFGYEGFFDNLLVDLAVSRDAFGSKVTYLDARRNRHASRLRLRHSSVCDDNTVTDQVAEWIERVAHTPGIDYGREALLTQRFRSLGI
jgi:hypothetical protein